MLPSTRVSNTSPRLVLFDKGDVAKLPDLYKSGYSALALSPSAYDEAAARNLVVCSTRLTFGNFGHARCVVAGRRALADFDEISWPASVPPGVLVMARQSAWMIACLVERLKCTLKSGPWIVCDRAGSWAEVTDRLELLRILLPRIWAYGLGHFVDVKRPVFPVLLRYWVQLFSCQLSIGRKKWVIGATSKLRAGLRDALDKAGVGLVVLQPTRGGWSDYLIPMRGRKRGVVRLPIAPLPEWDSRAKTIRETLFRRHPIFRDNEVAFGWSCYEPYFCNAMLAMLGAIYDGPKLMRLSEAMASMAFEANAWMQAGVLDAAGEAKIPRIVLNHNSQPPCESAIANEVTSTLFSQRTCNSLVDVALIWSPWAERWRDSGNVDAKSVSFQPVSLNYPDQQVPSRESSRKFRVLHAGNYQNWSDFFPWAPETADEYLEGMESLAQVVAGLDDIELIFRVRTKREVDLHVIKRRLVLTGNISICGNDQDFLEQLSTCDLLVSHFSTTVEQALQMGKPVLLWGSTSRYCQFPGSSNIPCAEHKSAVYTVRRPEDLATMLVGIRNAHKDVVEVGEAWMSYRHPPNTPSLAEWVQRFISEERKTKWPM